jgi:MoaA/NifB/PqqE/SkfB family radical SAM enzyme
MHGEPTFHPDLPRMIKLVKDHGAHSVSIITNGTLIDKDLFIKLVNAGLDGMEISFEGTDKTNYEYQRAGAKFDVTKNNILRMCELKTLSPTDRLGDKHH